jgi:hypothetical protein
MSALVARRHDFRSAFVFVLAVALSIVIGGGAGYLLRTSPPASPHTVYVNVDPIADTQTCFWMPNHHKAC